MWLHLEPFFCIHDEIIAMQLQDEIDELGSTTIQLVIGKKKQMNAKHYLSRIHHSQQFLRSVFQSHLEGSRLTPENG